MTFSTLEMAAPSFAVELDRSCPAYSTGRESGYLMAEPADNGRRRRRWRMNWTNGGKGERELLMEAWTDYLGTTMPFYVWMPSRDRNVLTDSHVLTEEAEWTLGCDDGPPVVPDPLISTEQPTVLGPLGEYGGVYKVEVNVGTANVYGCVRKDFVGLYTLGPHNSVHDTGRISASQSLSCWFKEGDAQYVAIYIVKRAGGPPVPYGPIIDITDGSFVEQTNAQAGDSYDIVDWGGGWYRLHYHLPGTTATGGNNPTIGTVRQVFLYPIASPMADPQPIPPVAALYSYVYGPQLEEGSVVTPYQPTKAHATRVLARFASMPRFTQTNAATYQIEAEFEEVV
jgi:hypothetical protein